MNNVLAGLSQKVCMDYIIDDILVVGKTFDEHVENSGQYYNVSGRLV